jgi:hypothetical protein
LLGFFFSLGEMSGHLVVPLSDIRVLLVM